jgi:aryl-alcohol dehydrogenase-like predicted oxidoreductase
MKYKVFGSRTGLRVSQVSLGCGMFGKAWGYGADPKEARLIFEKYIEGGGNFFDTADAYQNGESEILLGEFLDSSRDNYVIATKYTQGNHDPSANGNSRKNMVQSVEASLRRLKTDHIDIYWTHMPDTLTPVDEIMRGFDDLVRAGKILYAGLSDFPAWRAAAAATLADARNWAPLAGIQIEYSLVERTPDREILPMAEAFDLGTVVWSPLAGGFLTGKYRSTDEGRAKNWAVPLIHKEDNSKKTAILDALFQIAQKTESNPGQVALAWIMKKGLIPIIGPRTADQVTDNLGATKVTLSDGQFDTLNTLSAIHNEFPHTMFERFEGIKDKIYGGNAALVDQPKSPVI